MTTGDRVTADNYPEHGPGTITDLDGKWAMVEFDNGAIVPGIHVLDLTPANH